MLGVQGAGCEPWLWRQENRGMILTARGQESGWSFSVSASLGSLGLCRSWMEKDEGKGTLFEGEE